MTFDRHRPSYYVASQSTSSSSVLRSFIFFRVMLCISTAYAVAQCLYVRPFDHLSVCLSRSCILSKRINISSNYFTVGWPCHSSFSAPNVVAKFRREPPNGDVECRLKKPIFDQYIASSRVVNAATVRCYQHGAAEPWQVGDTHRW